MEGDVEGGQSSPRALALTTMMKKSFNSVSLITSENRISYVGLYDTCDNK